MVPDARNISSQISSGVPDANIPSLVVAENGFGRLDIFNSSDQKIGVIDNPAGFLAMDPQANLYVANFHDQYKFKIFAPPYNGKPVVIPFPNGYLIGVAVDAKTGVFAVITIPNEAGGRPSNVSFFPHGATTPCAVVSAPNGMGEFGSTANFDASGVLYFDYIASPEADGVASIAGECQAKTIVQYTPAIRFIGALQFNARDELVIQQANGGNFGGPIETFAHPKNGVLGKLLNTTNLDNLDGQPPAMLSLSSDGKGVWAAPIFDEGVALYKYPAGGAPIRIIPGVKDVWAGAVFPQLVP